MHSFKFFVPGILQLSLLLPSSRFGVDSMASALASSSALGGGDGDGGIEGQRPARYYPAFFESLPSLAGKTVAITGCSRGLGYVTARSAAQKGASVIMLNRKGGHRAERVLEQLKSDSAAAAAAAADAASSPIESPPPEHHLVECDLLSFDSVRWACRRVRDLTTAGGDGDGGGGCCGIHALCNNAGIMLQPDAASRDGYDITASTNMLSHFLITRELLPLLERGARQSGEPSRVITMSSGSGYDGPPLDRRYFEKRGGDLGGDGVRASYDRYHQSKLANLAFACALHDRLLDSGKGGRILSLACTPGVCGTDMFSHATSVVNGGTAAPKSSVPSPADGAMAQLKCLFSPEVSSGELWGPGPDGSLVRTPMQPPRILVDAASKIALWEVCEQAVGKFDVKA